MKDHAISFIYKELINTCMWLKFEFEIECRQKIYPKSKKY